MSVAAVTASVTDSSASGASVSGVDLKYVVIVSSSDCSGLVSAVIISSISVATGPVLSPKTGWPCVGGVVAVCESGVMSALTDMCDLSSWCSCNAAEETVTVLGALAL